jgi:hypothetical protein
MFDTDYCSTVVTELTAAVGAVRAAGVPEVDMTLGSDVKQLLRLRLQIEGLLAERLVPFVSRDLADLEGAAKVGSWAAQELALAPGDVTSLYSAGKAAETHPELSRRQALGEVSARHVEAARRGLAGLPEDKRLAGDQQMAQMASKMTPKDLGWLAQRYRESVAPELSDKDIEDLDKEQWLKVSATFGGTKVDGWLTGKNAEWFTKAMDRFSKPTEDDIRDADRRRADAAGMIGRIAAEADLHARDLEGTGYMPADLPRARITIVADVITLQRALDAMADRASIPAWLPATEREMVTNAYGERTLTPVSWRDLVITACDADVQRLVLDADSQVLDLGREARLFSRRQRVALAKGKPPVCAWKRCGSPWVEAHHLTRWVDGGRTNVTEGVLLCPYHHTLIHMGWTLSEQPDGEVVCTPPDDWAYRRSQQKRRGRRGQPRAA